MYRLSLLPSVGESICCAVTQWDFVKVKESASFRNSLLIKIDRLCLLEMCMLHTSYMHDVSHPSIQNDDD